jgi:hypothetical protein
MSSTGINTKLGLVWQKSGENQKITAKAIILKWFLFMRSLHPDEP